jgi:hypothetical protein
LIQTHLKPSYQSVEIVLGHTGTPLLGVSNQLTVDQGQLDTLSEASPPGLMRSVIDQSSTPYARHEHIVQDPAEIHAGPLYFRSYILMGLHILYHTPGPYLDTPITVAEAVDSILRGKAEYTVAKIPRVVKGPRLV